jgi:predicted phage tail protein
VKAQENAMNQLSTRAGLIAYNQPDVGAESEAIASSAASSVAHAATAQKLTQRYAASMANNGALSLALAGRLWDPTVWSESLQMEAAIARRLHGQGLDFRKGCTVLLEDYGQLRQANTMSKLVEKQCNLMAQFGQLMTSQATNFVALLENIDVDYGYWASQKQSAPVR